MRSCLDCGRILDKQPDPSGPCPQCGGLRHNVTVHVVSEIGLTSTVSEVELAYGPDRPWSGKWDELKKSIVAVEAACRPSSGFAGQGITELFNSFFIKCYHLGDWLYEEPNAPLKQKPVRDFMEQDGDLVLCAAIANTEKHRTRRGKDPVTAVIDKIKYTANGISAIVSWSNSTSSGTEDSLDLAHRCMASWTKFLASNNLPT